MSSGSKDSATNLLTRRPFFCRIHSQVVEATLSMGSDIVLEVGFLLLDGRIRHEDFAHGVRKANGHGLRIPEPTGVVVQYSLLGRPFGLLSMGYCK